MAPVRANVRGTRDVQAISTSIVSPGATARASGTSATVRSSALPSSGAMNLQARREVDRRAARCDELEARDVDPAPVGSGVGEPASPARRRSRIQVERVFRQAFQ